MGKNIVEEMVPPPPVATSETTTIQVGNTITATIEDVFLHKEERKMMGASFGNYKSEYVAHLRGHKEWLVCIDELANSKHPEWERKTEKRAAILTKELKGTKLVVEVINVFGKDELEAKIVSPNEQ